MFERGGYNSDRKFKDNFEDSRRNDFDFEQTTVGSRFFISHVSTIFLNSIFFDKYKKKKKKINSMTNYISNLFLCRIIVLVFFIDRIVNLFESYLRNILENI